MMDNRPRSDFARSASYWLRRAGMASWLFLGVVVAAGVLFDAVAAVSGITIPLLMTIAAGVVGGILAMILAVPLTAVVIQTVTRLRQEGVFEED
jgi:hypothetical protein